MSRVSPLIKLVCARGAPRISTRIAAKPAAQCTGSFSTFSITFAKKFSPTTSSPSKSSAKGKGKSKASHDVLADEKLSEKEIEEVLKKAEVKMEKAMDWFRGILYEGVERGRGRVTPALLDSVKVSSPDMGSVSLQSVASVTVRGSTLYVEVFDSDSLKAVDSAIAKANLPGLSPQRIDSRSLKIPVARPTEAQRQQIVKQGAESAESAKQQIRLARTEGLKALGGRDQDGSKEMQTLTDKFGLEIDEQVAKAKKELAKA